MASSQALLDGSEGTTEQPQRPTRGPEAAQDASLSVDQRKGAVLDGSATNLTGRAERWEGSPEDAVETVIRDGVVPDADSMHDGPAGASQGLPPIVAHAGGGPSHAAASAADEPAVDAGVPDAGTAAATGEAAVAAAAAAAAGDEDERPRRRRKKRSRDKGT